MEICHPEEDTSPTKDLSKPETFNVNARRVLRMTLCQAEAFLRLTSRFSLNLSSELSDDFFVKGDDIRLYLLIAA